MGGGYIPNSGQPPGGKSPEYSFSSLVPVRHWLHDPALRSWPVLLLVADEPTSALDVSVQAAILNQFADLQRGLGFSCLFISHNLAVVHYLCDRIAVMQHCEIIETGTREQVFQSPSHPYTRELLSATAVSP